MATLPRLPNFQSASRGRGPCSIKRQMPSKNHLRFKITKCFVYDANPGQVVLPKLDEWVFLLWNDDTVGGHGSCGSISQDRSCKNPLVAEQCQGTRDIIDIA